MREKPLLIDNQLMSVLSYINTMKSWYQVQFNSTLVHHSMWSEAIGYGPYF